jgi:LysM repeat protein
MDRSGPERRNGATGEADTIAMPITTALRQTNANANANAASPAATVTVKSGDTLSAIATRHGPEPVNDFGNRVAGIQ